jgi:hypothetical protein
VIRESKKMNIDRLVNAMAGFFILLSLGLGVEASPIFHHVYWLWFTVFVGANLLQASFTGFCPAAMIFKKLGAKPGAAFN